MSTTSNLADLIRDFLLERTSLLMRHEDVAQQVPDYDINNAYQYIIAREQTHLSWLQHALLDLGAPLPADPPRQAVAVGKGDAWKALAADDARVERAVRREVARQGGRGLARPPQGHAEGGAGRNARAQAPVRPGRGRQQGPDRHVARHQRPHRRRHGRPLDGAIATTTVAIALGSNLGDREAHLAFAVGRLAAILTNLRQSTWYDTAPVGVGEQPRYLNGVVVGETDLTPRALLDTAAGD